MGGPATQPTNPMKTRIVFCAILMAAAFPLTAGAGTIFYVPIPAEGSDAQSGLNRSKVYTNGIVAGNRKEAGRNVNGVPLAPLLAAGNSSTANGVTEFLLTTMWDSYDAIRKFAGDDFERARYYGEDDAFLLEREEFVTHYEVLADS